jgi:hypothetical protein
MSGRKIQAAGADPTEPRPRPAALVLRVDRRLPFEAEPVAKWIGGNIYLRLIALVVLFVRRKREPVPAHLPWRFIGLAVGGFLIEAAAIGAVLLLLHALTSQLVRWNYFTG